MAGFNPEFDWVRGADDPDMARRLAEIRRIGTAAKVARAQGSKVDQATTETLLNHLQKEAGEHFDRMADQLAEYKAGFEILSRFVIAMLRQAGVKDGDGIDLPKAALDDVPTAAQIACQPHQGRVYLRYRMPGADLGKVDLRAKEG